MSAEVAQTPANHFYVKCTSNKTNAIDHQAGYASLTSTRLRVAPSGRVAYTILAAICRRRVAAVSALIPTITGFRARPEIGPPAVKCGFAGNAIYNVINKRAKVSITYLVRPSGSHSEMQCQNDTDIAH